MDSEHQQIQTALRTRRMLTKHERQNFPEPKSASMSPKDLVHWITGMVIQDHPALVLIAVSSLAYSIVHGILSLAN